MSLMAPAQLPARLGYALVLDDGVSVRRSEHREVVSPPWSVGS
jgi:hypothetical protein